MLKNYLIIAWRNVSKNKLYTLINISGLSLGITACFIIYLITVFEFSFDTFHKDKDRIYRVTGSQVVNGTKSYYGYVPSPLPNRLKQLTGIEHIAGFYNYRAKVDIPQKGQDTKVFDMPKQGNASPIIITQPDYFKLFSYQWLQGNPATALAEPFKIVLSESEAHKYFGPEDLGLDIGKEVIVNDSLHLTVSGIVAEWRGNTDLHFTAFISFATVEHSFLKNDIDLGNWGTWDSNSQAFISLNKQTGPGQVNRQFTQFVKANFGVTNAAGVELKLQPLNNIHFNTTYTDSFSRQADLPTLYALIGIALFILVIAIVNFVNLTTAQSTRRAKEIGIRKTLGSSRAKLVFQFLAETALLTLCAMIVSLFLIKPTLSLFTNYLPVGIRFQPFNPVTLLFVIGIFLITSVLAGLYPARVLSRDSSIHNLQGRGSGHIGYKDYFRKGLIAFQFAVSLVFIICTLGVGRQINFLLHSDMGFNRDEIITVQLPQNEQNTVVESHTLVNAFKQLTEVEAISLHRGTPMANRHGNTTIKTVGRGTAEINSAFEFGDANYIPLYGIKILAGRNIAQIDTIKEFVINAICAKELGFQDPAGAIGQKVEVGLGGKTGTVVGIIDDFHSKTLHEAVQPFFLTSNTNRQRTLSIKLLASNKQASNIGQSLAVLSNVWAKLYPSTKFEYHFIDDTIASFYESEQKMERLVNMAMLIAIFISCIGLYGMSSFITQQRTKEIGIRKIHGATVAEIIAMLFRDFLKPIMLSIVIASPIAWYFMHRWLEGFVYRVHVDWLLFAVAGMSAVFIALVTVSFQATRTAMANPVNSLRVE